MYELRDYCVLNYRTRLLSDRYSKPWGFLVTFKHFSGYSLISKRRLFSIHFLSNSVVSYYLLTYSMVQSPSWEANCFAASQEIPRISRNPKVHYRTHKRPPPISILGPPNPVHIPTSWRSIIILSTHLRLGLPSDLFPSGLPIQVIKMAHLIRGRLSMPSGQEYETLT